jgi:hypothetical protein
MSDSNTPGFPPPDFWRWKWTPEDRARIDRDVAAYEADAPAGRQAAIELAAQGWCVFPVYKRDYGWDPETQKYRHKAKTPVLKGGFKNAVNNPAEAAEVWRIGCGDLVGYATGEESDKVVLDLDLSKHPETAGAWLREHGGKLPDNAFVYETQSGGQHWVFRWRPGMSNLKCNSGVLARGVDIRANGGYACAWWRAGCPILLALPEDGLPEWPGWLDELLAKAAREKYLSAANATAVYPDTPPSPDNLKAADMDVMAAIVRQIPNGEFFDARETWIGFAHAIAAAFADDLNLAEELWFEHCEKREQSEDEPEKVWLSVLVQEHLAGAGYIINVAKKHGIDVSANVRALRAASPLRAAEPIPQSVGAAAVSGVDPANSGNCRPKDNREKETRWQIFSLLRQGVPGARLLAEVHAYNEKRAVPINRDRVNELIAWALERHKESKNV